MAEIAKSVSLLSELKRNLIKMSTDSNVLSFLKKRGLQCLEEKFENSDFHLLALFLNPKFKSLRSPDLTNDDKKEFMTWQDRYCRKLFCSHQLFILTKNILMENQAKNPKHLRWRMNFLLAM